MASAQIKVNGSFGSREDLLIGASITLTNGDNTGATSWLWELADAPEGSLAVSSFSGFTSNTATITLDKEGTYLFKLTVNGTLQDVQYAAILSQHTGLRVPAAGETYQASPEKGWALTVNRDFAKLERDQRQSHKLTAIAADTISIGPVYADSIGVLANGDSLMTVRPASALAMGSSRNVMWALNSAVAGEPVALMTLGLTEVVSTFNTSASSFGAPVYLSDTAGGVSLTAGTLPVAIGKVFTLANPGRFFFAPESTVASSLANTTPSQIDAADTGSAGADGYAARSDHQHAVNTGSSGDVVPLNDTASGGTSPKLARIDHAHTHGSLTDPAAHAVATAFANGFISSASQLKLNNLPTNAAPITSSPPAAVTAAASVVGASTEAARADHKHDVSTAIVGAIALDDVASAGSSSSLARADHLHGFAASLVDPTNVTAGDAAAVGVATTPSRSDHKHDVSTAAAGAIVVGASAAEGSASSLARSDHTHSLASPAAPADVTKDTASAGSSFNVARADHKHDVTTAAPAATGVATASADGSATTLARSDHAHQSNTAPVDVTKAAAAIGTSGEPARADHKHDVSTAAAASVSTSTTNAEGAATTLARSDHTHAVSVGASQATAGTDATTASATDVLMTGMTLTPGAGDYFASFSADADHSSPTDTVTISLYVNSVQVANSERAIIPGALRSPLVLTYLLTGVAAAQAIEIKWRTSAATATVHKRALTLLKVG
jgi:hypothetical protein